VTLTTWIPIYEADKHRISCNDSSNYRQWHVHHIITCQINSALKHLRCGWAEKNSSNLRELLYKGHVRKLRVRTARKHRCPRTTSPQNWNKTQHNTASCVTFNCVPHHTHLDLAWAVHRQCSDTKGPSALTSDAQKMLIFKVRTSSSPQRSFYIKENCFFCFSVSSTKTDCCHCMTCPQDANGEGGC